jgi:hypothetical protein
MQKRHAVWCAWSTNGTLGQFFSNSTVTANHTLHFFKERVSISEKNLSSGWGSATDCERSAGYAPGAV